MRAELSVVAVGLVVLGACGRSESDDPTQTGGQASSGSSAAGSSSGAEAGGTSAGGSSGGVEAGTATGGALAGAAPQAGAAALVDCDPRKILCKRVAPTCGTLEVPSVEGSCYGECVPIERCACDGPEACPSPEQYTCWNNVRHCGPFLR